MSVFVDIEEAKTNLRVTGSASDAEIQLLLDTAEAIVLEYIGYADLDAIYAEFGEVDSYFTIEAAVKLVLTNLYDKRDENPLSQAAMDLLRRWRPLIVVGESDDV